MSRYSAEFYSSQPGSTAVSAAAVGGPLTESNLAVMARPGEPVRVYFEAEDDHAAYSLVLAIQAAVRRHTTHVRFRRNGFLTRWRPVYAEQEVSA